MIQDVYVSAVSSSTVVIVALMGVEKRPVAGHPATGLDGTHRKLSACIHYFKEICCHHLNVYAVLSVFQVTTGSYWMLNICKVLISSTINRIYNYGENFFLILGLLMVSLSRRKKLFLTLMIWLVYNLCYIAFNCYYKIS